MTVTTDKGTAHKLCFYPSENGLTSSALSLILRSMVQFRTGAQVGQRSRSISWDNKFASAILLKRLSSKNGDGEERIAGDTKLAH